MNKKFKFITLVALTVSALSISMPLVSTTAYASVVPHVAYPKAGQYKWVNADGNFASNQWAYTKIISTIGNATEGWMYFGADGNVKKGWFSAGGKWYYSEEKRDYEDRTKDTYFICTETWAPDEHGNLLFYLDKDGAMKTGWFQAHDGYWYYCDESGKMQYNTTIDGKYKLDFKGHWIIPEKY